MGKRKFFLALFLTIGLISLTAYFLFKKDAINVFDGIVGKLSGKRIETADSSAFNNVETSYSKYYELGKLAPNNWGVLKGVEGTVLRIEPDLEKGAIIGVALADKVVLGCITSNPDSAEFADVYIDYSKMTKENVDALFEEAAFDSTPVAKTLETYYVGYRIRFNMEVDGFTYTTSNISILETPECYQLVE